MMLDIETNSLWSHILGQAMEGKLKGSDLTSLPSDMVTWKQWRSEHPKTSVLNLQRSGKDFVKDFYKKPERFVVGFSDGEKAYHCTFATMIKTPLFNVEINDLSLLISFDPKSTSAKIFNRKVDGKVLEFVFDKDDLMHDRQTKTVWSRRSGNAVKGPLKAKQLQMEVAIVSFARAWKKFHPDSKELLPSSSKPKTKKSQ